MSKAVQSRNIGPKRRNLKSAINNRSPLLDQWKTQGRTAQERSSLPRRIMTSEGERLKSVRETTVSNEIREVLIDFSRKNSKSPSAKANKPWLSMNRL